MGFSIPSALVLGAQRVNASNTDLDTLVTEGKYYYLNGAPLHGPSGVYNGTLDVYSSNGFFMFQEIHDYNLNAIFRRSLAAGGSWSSWERIYDTSLLTNSALLGPLASALGGQSSLLLKGVSGSVTTTSVLGSDRRMVNVDNLCRNRVGIIILQTTTDATHYSVYAFSDFNRDYCLYKDTGDDVDARVGISYYSNNWIMVVYSNTDKVVDYRILYYDV